MLRSPRRFAVVLWWTLAHWLLNALAFWVGFRAAGMDLPFSAALFLQGIIAIGVAVPQAPGFFGVFEHFARIGLVGVYGVSRRCGGELGDRLSPAELHPHHAHRRVVLPARRALDG